MKEDAAAKARKRLVDRARKAMLALTDAERGVIHREVGCCICAGVVEVVAARPRVALGAVLGAAGAALLEAARKAKGDAASGKR